MKYTQNTLKLLFLILIPFVISSCSKETISTSESYEGVELPDNSIVYLNHNSSISYDKDFESRKVELTGEAYFNVTSGATPFIITTSLGEVSVLGTEFNVKLDDEELEVEVESGTVELTTTQGKNKLTKGQKAHYNKRNNKIDLGNAELEFKQWVKLLEIEFKNLGKEIKKGSKVVEKETQKIGKDLKKEGEKLNKKLQKLN